MNCGSLFRAKCGDQALELPAHRVRTYNLPGKTVKGIVESPSAGWIAGVFKLTRGHAVGQKMDVDLGNTDDNTIEEVQENFDRMVEQRSLAVEGRTTEAGNIEIDMGDMFASQTSQDDDEPLESNAFLSRYGGPIVSTKPRGDVSKRSHSPTPTKPIKRGAGRGGKQQPKQQQIPDEKSSEKDKQSPSKKTTAGSSGSGEMSSQKALIISRQPSLFLLKSSRSSRDLLLVRWPAR